MNKKYSTWPTEFSRRSVVNFLITAVALLPAYFSAAAESNGNVDSMQPSKFSLFDHSMIPIGDWNASASNGEGVCKLRNEGLNHLFEFLMVNGSVGSLVEARVSGQDICGVRYVPLGNQRYMVLNKGLGFIDLKSGTYSKVVSERVDIDYLSDAYLSGDSKFVMIYEAMFSEGRGEVKAYYGVVIDTKTGKIQYAKLANGSIGDENGNPVCSMESSGNEKNQQIHLISGMALRQYNSKKLQIKFSTLTKNCDTNLVRKNFEIYEFDGKFFVAINGKRHLKSFDLFQ